MKEPEITLFGRKIVLPENAGESSDEGNSGRSSAADYDHCLEMSGEEENGENADEEKQRQTEKEKSAENSQTKPEQKDQEPQNPKTPSITEDLESENNPKTENEQSDATNGQQKTLKKPDKILPCPRCNSMDTKFCYYNNYNVNQPRHFCKSCQRYWTAGGTMRNVPVGAGRRKNKNAANHCRHITISEGPHANSTVLSFGVNSPLCDPVAEKRASYGVRNGYHNSCKNGENVDDSNSIGSENGPRKPVIQNINGFPSPVPFVPSPFPWNPAVPLYPMPFYPAPYWNVPWISGPNTEIGPSPKSYLGKHSRNGELIKPNSEENRENSELNDSESCIVVPKTLRIDDPEEAAKSSIWETLGIKYGSISREGLFKALQPKVDEKKAMVSDSSVLQANPAALSRSISFRERA